GGVEAGDVLDHPARLARRVLDAGAGERPLGSDAQVPPGRHGSGGRRRELLGALRRDQLVDDRAELARENLVERVKRETDAVVGHPLFLEVVRADLLRTAAAL